MLRAGQGRGRRGMGGEPWYLAPQYAGMAAIADFNNDRYALPTLGSERIKNASAADWTQALGSLTWNNGTVRVTADGTSAGRASQTLTGLTPGSLFWVTFNFTSSGTGATAFASTGMTSAGALSSTALLTGTAQSFSFVVPPSGTVNLLFSTSGVTAGAYAEFSAFSAKEVQLSSLRSATRDEFFSQYTASGTTSRSYLDRTGTLKNDLLANVPRFDWTNGKRQLLLENQSTNLIVNSQGVGAAVGSPGTSPNNWFITATLTREIVGIGVEDGIPYIDVRFAGDGSTSFRLAGGGNITASASTTYTGSWYCRVVAGSLVNTPLSLRIVAETVTVSTSGSVAIVPTDAPLKTQRFSVTKTTLADTNSIRCDLFNIPNGQPFDVTLRVALPTIEPGSFNSMPIISANSGAQTTRPIETFRLAPIVEAILQRSEGGVVVRCDLTANSGARRLLGIAGAASLIHAASSINQVAAYDGTTSLSATLGTGVDNSLPIGAAMGFDTTGRAISGNGGGVASDALATGTRTPAYLGRSDVVAASVPYADGRYDFLGILASRPSNARLQELAVAA